jgi:FKBP-type peptidyl-prolyl cis-trans isomerase FklB
MKKLIFTVVSVAVAVSMWGQQGSKTPKTTTKPVAQQPVLKTLNDSASYAIGVGLASFYRQQGITSLNTTLVSKAINDVLSGKGTLMDENACNMAVMTLVNNIQAERSKPTIEAGKAFLAKNKQRPEVKTTASGLQYEVIKEGTGVKPASIDTFVCNYRGTFIDGTEFDNSYKRGEPLVLPVTSVIRGWTEGLQLMSVGSHYKFWIPYNLGYGPMDYNTIPGGSALIFEVELLEVRKPN